MSQNGYYFDIHSANSVFGLYFRIDKSNICNVRVSGRGKLLIRLFAVQMGKLLQPIIPKIYYTGSN